MGIGWDSSLLAHPEIPRYLRYISFNGMLALPHYKDWQPGYWYQERLFEELARRLGPALRYDGAARKFLFPKRVEYWYLQDLKIEVVEYDVFVRKYFPSKRYVEGRKIHCASSASPFRSGETVVKEYASDQESFRHWSWHEMRYYSTLLTRERTLFYHPNTLGLSY